MIDKISDPVCGMTINPHEALAQTVYRGEVYYFCSDECKQKFDKHPEQYTHNVPEKRPVR